MRRIVGAWLVFAAALLYRGDDLVDAWKPVSPTASRTAGEADTAAARRAAETAGAAGKSDGHAAGSRGNSAPKAKTASPSKQAPPDFRRNPLIFLSSAPKDSLVLLPGVGPVIADRIIAARTGKRSFKKWEDLLAVKGIGPKTLDRMKRLAGTANP